MYINNFILSVLYIPLVYFLLKYISFLNKKTILFKQNKSINKLLVVLFVGSLISMLTAANNGKFPSNSATIDILRILNFLLVFIIPPVLAENRIIYRDLFKRVLKIGFLVFILAVGYSLLTVGIGSSAFYGNFFGATTVNLTITSIIAFYGLFIYYIHRDLFGLILSLLSWVIALVSLAKWNLWIDIAIPVLLYRVIIKTNKKQIFRKWGVIVISLVLFSALILPNINNYLNTFASLQDYSSFQNYLDSRVFRTITSDNIVYSGTLFDLGGRGISDGARFGMWKDLLIRTIHKPFFGLGFGVRAYENQGYYMEDHSVVIFIISRFGFFIAAFVIYFISRILKTTYFYFKNKNYAIAKDFYFAIMGNFFFQSSVGMIWGQLPVTLTLGVLISLMFAELMSINRNEKRTLV